MMSGKEPLVWAKAVLAYDTPDKAQVASGEQPGRLMWKRVEQAAEGATSELISFRLTSFRRIRVGFAGQVAKAGCAVRVLTNSLASTDVPLVHAGYLRYRIPLLQVGTELYEVKPWPVSRIRPEA
jgi:putative cardiolipin synthase